MRSSWWAPIAGWCVATASSIVLASMAILPVLREPVAEDRTLSRLPAAQTPGPPTPLPSSAAVPTGTTSPTPRTSPDQTESTTPQAVQSRRPTTRPSRTTAPTVTTEDGWTVTVGDDGVRSYVRSFRVEGGQAVVRMTSVGVVELVTATPADGYAVQKVQNSPDNMAVYFNAPGRSFIIHAIWWDDRPFVQVSKVGS
ncbi:DNA mismatch repair protein MutL [Micromonospora craniellae]|uniref:DNA mismatch repair protein MutL n=1 Tax=Micromonospora craniellae TaxID=2294034 RepID=A0A372FWI7_9ACTN|nr:DNA mismatch repair protein MutL [Micromonospora craniellae]QOC93190.1 DNA mismatch repair protein MutL [Micromonospora craniellae]RFS44839.1 DNA mismatch repair protein MutL [Micromonospora craniellae]